MDLKRLTQVILYLVDGRRTPGLAMSMNIFNEMRSNMAAAAFKTIKNKKLTQQIRKADAVKQISTVPERAVCAVSGETLTDNNGILLILEIDRENKAVSIHSRFVDATYQLFLASHFDQHIIRFFTNWCKTQMWYIPGRKFSEAPTKFIEYNRQSNVKSLMVQLSG